MRTSGALTLVLLTLLLGCDEPALPDPRLWQGDPPDLPSGAPTVNCVAPHHRLSYPSSFGEAEAVVVARCKEIRQYATVQRGQWDFLWYVVAFDVIRVERGEWSDMRVAFCYYGTRPTPESGIHILYKTAPCPCVRGRVLALALEPRGVPPRVAGQEWRSRLPPHGEPQRLFSFEMMQSEEGKRLYERLDTAVRDFAEHEGWPEVGAGSHFEETDDAYVLEVILQTDGEINRRAVAVDKETFAVREVP